jgi:hypothetical protein
LSTSSDGQRRSSAQILRMTLGIRTVSREGEGSGQTALLSQQAHTTLTPNVHLAARNISIQALRLPCLSK